MQMTSSPALAESTTAAAAGERTKLVAIQVLRGFAACIVVLGHALEEAFQMSPTYGAPAFKWGSGVDIFFVISGLIMVLTSQKLIGSWHGTVRFLRRRIVRIVPLYWFYTIAMIAAMALLPHQLNFSELKWEHILGSFFFIPVERADGSTHPVLGLGWTLNFEMFFYVLFGLALMLRRGLNEWVTIGVLALLVLLGALGAFQATPLVVWSNPIILEFAAGMGLGLLYLRGERNISPLLFGICLCAAMAVFVIGYDLPRQVSVGIPATLLVFAFVFRPSIADNETARSIARWVGDSSYSIYLSHPFSLALVKLLWLKTIGLQWPTAYVFVAFLASLAGGMLSYLVVEKPMLEWLRGRKVSRADGGAL